MPFSAFLIGMAFG